MDRGFIFQMPDIPEDWPIWAVLLFLILINFKGTLIKFLPDTWRRHQEHGQEIEEIQLNAKLQTQASEQLRASWREEQLVETIQSHQDFIQNVLTQEIKSQHEVIGSLRDEIRSLRHAILRTFSESEAGQ